MSGRGSCGNSVETTWRPKALLVRLRGELRAAAGTSRRAGALLFGEGVAAADAVIERRHVVLALVALESCRRPASRAWARQTLVLLAPPAAEGSDPFWARQGTPCRSGPSRTGTPLPGASDNRLDPSALSFLSKRRGATVRRKRVRRRASRSALPRTMPAAGGRLGAGSTRLRVARRQNDRIGHRARRRVGGPRREARESRRADCSSWHRHQRRSIRAHEPGAYRRGGGSPYPVGNARGPPESGIRRPPCPPAWLLVANGVR